MDLKLFLYSILLSTIQASVIKNDTVANDIPDNVFNGVYSECFLHLSYSCLQKKTLLYLKELNNLSEVSVIGDYVKFVKINKSHYEEDATDEIRIGENEELAFMIDKAIDNFFDNHVLKFYALGRNVSMPRNVEEFVGRKKRKGGGGGGGGHGGDGGGHDDGGKKKMMMMAMMCMKMKLMMMVPAMMGMMGMMSFKGMMFSMMSFMISKMMLLMKILEKKGGVGGLGGGGGGGGLDGGWPAGGAGGGAWMPAGGQDYAGGGGGGGGGYDANGQWQSRSIVENLGSYKTLENYPDVTIVKPIDTEKWHDVANDDKAQNNGKWVSETPGRYIKPMEKGQWKSHSTDESPDRDIDTKPEISFIKRTVRYNNKIEREMESNKNPVLVYKRSNVNFDFHEPGNIIGEGSENYYDKDKPNSRSKRDLRQGKVPKKLAEQYEHQLYLQPDKDSDKTIYTEKHIDELLHVNLGNKNEESKVRTKSKLRQKRSILNILQNSYIYWVNQILGLNNNRRTNPSKYKIVNGIKYVYYPYKMQRPKMPKELQINADLKPLVAVEEFNKGEIIDGGIESRMNKKKFHKMKDSVNDTVDMVEDNPWE